MVKRRRLQYGKVRTIANSNPKHVAANKNTTENRRHKMGAFLPTWTDFGNDQLSKLYSGVTNPSQYKNPDPQQKMLDPWVMQWPKSVPSSKPKTSNDAPFVGAGSKRTAGGGSGGPGKFLRFNPATGSSAGSSMSSSRSRSYSSISENSSQNRLGDMYGPAKRCRKTRIFPTKKRASKAQRIISTITPVRSLTYQFNGVMEGQQLKTQALPTLGAPTPFSSAEFAYGSNTSVPTDLSGIFGQVAQDKADPGCNAWAFQTLFHGSVIDQLQSLCAAQSDALPGIGTSSLIRNNMFYISSYSVVHTLHNPLSTPVYVVRYEIVPRLHLKNVSDLLFTMQHRAGQGDDVVTNYASSTIVTSDRTWVTPDVNPNEFPIFKARFRILKKRKFTINPGQTITIPFAGKMNRKVDMNDYVFHRNQTLADSALGSTAENAWGNNGSFMCKGLTKILAYQAFGVPAVQGVSDNTTIGSALSNRATTTPAQLILRATVKYKAHGAVDTARRYGTFRLSDAVETAASAVTGQAGSSTHQITVTNQI